MSSSARVISITDRFSGDRYWHSLLILFTEQPKLQQCLKHQYVDIENGIVNASALKRIAKPWSNTERFMLNLALHLFNSRNKVDLSGMDSLDYKNTQLALKAIRIRYSS